MAFKSSAAFFDVIASEYDIDPSTLFECVAQACRQTYGVLEIDKFQGADLLCFALDKGGRIRRKTINVTESGMKRIVKSTIAEIESRRSLDKAKLTMMSYSNVMRILENDIAAISGEAVTLKVISTRVLSEKEKLKFKGVKQFVVVRASRKLYPAEVKYFKEKSSLLKKGVAFVLD